MSENPAAGWDDLHGRMSAAYDQRAKAYERRNRPERRVLRFGLKTVAAASVAAMMLRQIEADYACQSFWLWWYLGLGADLTILVGACGYVWTGMFRWR